MKAALLAFGLTFVLMPISIWWLRRHQLFDIPNERSSHEWPTPRGAGAALAVGAVVGSAFSPVFAGPGRVGLLVAAVAFGLIGLADDLRSIAPFSRLALQATASIAALPWLLSGLSGPSLGQLAFTVACFLWLVSLVNAFNFMDGINGISGGVAFIAGASWSVVARIVPAQNLGAAGAVIAAAALAFLPFNFPRGRIFLGDVGSYFVGAWLAAAVIIGLREGVAVAPEALLAPLSLYLADTAFTIVRRVRAGRSWYTPHRSHTYQRLVALGWSHTRTTLVVTAATAICAGLGLVSLSTSAIARVAADLAIVGVLALYLSAPQLLSLRSKHASIKAAG